jgi:hypothetical protein
MILNAMREDERGHGREYVGGRLADAEFAEDQKKKAGEKDDLAGPPLASVRAVAATFAVQDAHDQSSR